MAEFVVIPARFNGPPASANGGYTCGVVASLLGADVAQVSLRAPPPVGQPLSVTHEDGRVELHDGATIVAEGEPSELLLDVPDPVHPDDAEAASEAGLERWSAAHPFPTCVVCGPKRAPGDGYRIFPGPLPGSGGMFASQWTPDPSLAGDDGLVRPECVWGALDCPTSAPVVDFGAGPPSVLARLTARLGCPVRVGDRHSLVSWPLEADGRKRHSACALFDADGRLLCAARALWIELREVPAA
ncbi:MAG TPA: hotdog fold domain-containing protein [Thermoleophilaceae bacterium]|nr:hotdog fold domain-containing protein [Thermoleophilaceae bacterium]